MVTVTLLGTAQDGGRPQPGCTKPCCIGLDAEQVRDPVSLGILDDDGVGHLVEATRALGQQLHRWKHPQLASVLLTHAHFGHVDGLGLFGRETVNARGLALFASPSMLALVDATPAWALLVEQGVFLTRPLSKGAAVPLGSGLSVEAVPIPHRAELSDMHAFVFRGPNRSLLFLPDHDRWEDTLAACGKPSLRAWLADLAVDVALLDGTFWSADELDGRSQQEVPHPPVQETLERLGKRREADPDIVFVHLNHTNPLHDVASLEHQTVTSLGWRVGQQGMSFTL